MSSTSLSERVVQVAMHLQAASLPNHVVQHEYITDSGRIDLLVYAPSGKIHLIEVKELKCAKHALGQLLAYAKDLNKLGKQLTTSTVLLYNKKLGNTSTLSPNLKSAFADAGIRVVYAHEIFYLDTLSALQTYYKTKQYTPCLNPKHLQILSLY